MFRPTALSLAIIAALALSGCKTAAEKAEDYYRSGMSYLAQGDEERGLLELRNVFRYDGFHKEARRAYAEVLIKRGELAEGYGQYLRLIEQYPDTVEVRRILAEMALQQGRWDEAQRHGEAAMKLTPGAPELEPVRISLGYRTAALLRDEPQITALAKEAETLLAGPQAGNLLLSRVVIDQALTQRDFAKALPLITRALEADPKMEDMQMLRYSILREQGDSAAIGDQLKRMATFFPENVQIRNTLVSWYVETGDAAGAEAYMRGIAGDPKGDTAAHLTVVSLLGQLKGEEAALTELRALREANAGTPNADFYGAELARHDFARGKTAEAIAALREILAKAEPSDQSRRIWMDLARFVEAEGNRDEAKKIVAEVLAADRSNVGALKLRAVWAIGDDRPGDAIVDLRSALDQAPRDSEILTLMAMAHERDGSIDLTGERLALAMEASEGAVPETLGYADFLIRQKRMQVAARVLSDARQRHPADIEILGRLSEVYIAEGIWDRALEVVTAMEGLPLNEAGQARVRAQRAAVLAGQNRIDESLALLSQDAEGGLANSARLLQGQIRAGRLDEARALLDKLRAESPQEDGLKMMDASLSGIEGHPDQAEAIWREMLAATPAAEAPAQMLYGYLVSVGRRDEATQVIDAALAAQAKPSQVLRWLKAGDLESQGRIGEAIALYEAMYAEDDGNMVVANNLSSLLASQAQDAAGIERAERIARRLRGQQVPAFQDTYGWIALQRGNLEEARSHLEPAAAGLPEDAVVQMHLGLLYEKLNLVAEARKQLELALSLEVRADLVAALEPARAALARLNARTTAPAEGAPAQAAPAGLRP